MNVSSKHITRSIIVVFRKISGSKILYNCNKQDKNISFM